LVAAGIKALISPARCPAAGGAPRAGSEDINKQRAPAIRRLKVSTISPFPQATAYFLGLRELCQSAGESQRYGALGVTSVVTLRCRPCRSLARGVLNSFQRQT